jgi:hypothetical protein
MAKNICKKILVHTPVNFLANPHQETNTGRYTNNNNNVNKAIKTNNLPNHDTKEEKKEEKLALYKTTSKTQVFKPIVYWLTNHTPNLTTSHLQMEVQTYV